MKILAFLFSVLFASFAFADVASAQNASDNLLEKVDLKFYLDGEPKPEDVGFDNPKSFWKLEYELGLTDSAELEKLGRCHRNEKRQLVCPIIRDKKLDKKIRKISMRIAKGKFTRKSLLSESNREVTIPIQLSPEVIEIFNQAANVYKKNPTFVLFVKTKASTKIASKTKFKRKFSTSGVHPLKSYAHEKDVIFWNVKSFGMALSITKSEDGTLRGFGIFR